MRALSRPLVLIFLAGVACLLLAPRNEARPPHSPLPMGRPGGMGMGFGHHWGCYGYCGNPGMSPTNQAGGMGFGPQHANSSSWGCYGYCANPLASGFGNAGLGGYSNYLSNPAYAPQAATSGAAQNTNAAASRVVPPVSPATAAQGTPSATNPTTPAPRTNPVAPPGTNPAAPRSPVANPGTTNPGTTPATSPGVRPTTPGTNPATTPGTAPGTPGTTPIR